jgi:hypothetical protein
MAENYCELFKQCEGFDGRLLIDRTVAGPALALEEGELPFGSMSMQGGSLHPYARISYAQKWIPQDACYGPVRSVMGLAPGETVTTEVRTRDQVDYVQLVQHAMESTEVRTTTRHQGRETTEANTVEMGPLNIGLFGSFLEDIGDAVGGAVSAVGDAVTGVVGGVIDTVESILGIGGGGGGTAGPRSVHEQMVTTINDTLESVQTSESNHTLTETTTSRSRTVERSINRMFSNPYRDRALELRFIPVFRRFEVVTTLSRVDIGLLMKAGALRFPEVGVGAKFGHFLQQRVADPRIASVATADLGLDDELGNRTRGSAVSEHLNANAVLYTKRFFAHSEAQRDNDMIRQPVARIASRLGKKPASTKNLLNALAWSRTKVKDNHVHVPLADPANALSALKLPRDLAERFNKQVISRIYDPAFLSTFTFKKNVFLFIGTHIEPVAGQCILPDVPESLPDVG